LRTIPHSARRVAALYEIEKRARGRQPDERQRLRQNESEEKFETLLGLLQATPPAVPSGGELAGAIRYAVGRKQRTTAYLDDVDGSSVAILPNAPSMASSPARRLPVRWIRRLQRERDGHVHARRDRKTQWRRSAGLACPCHRNHCRSLDDKNRRPPAMNLATNL